MQLMVLWSLLFFFVHCTNNLATEFYELTREFLILLVFTAKKKTLKQMTLTRDHEYLKLWHEFFWFFRVYSKLNGCKEKSICTFFCFYANPFLTLRLSFISSTLPIPAFIKLISVFNDKLKNVQIFAQISGTDY